MYLKYFLIYFLPAIIFMLNLMMFLPRSFLYKPENLFIQNGAWSDIVRSWEYFIYISDDFNLLGAEFIQLDNVWYGCFKLKFLTILKDIGGNTSWWRWMFMLWKLYTNINVCRWSTCMLLKTFLYVTAAMNFTHHHGWIIFIKI